MRREPVQARSAERVTLLLDTTAILVSEVGLDKITTALVAKRSGMSIGAVYRFFPDRLALLRALAARNLERFVERTAGSLLSGNYEHWWDAIDAGVDDFVEMYRNEPGFSGIKFGDAVAQRLLDGDASNNEFVSEAFRVMLVEQYGVEDHPDLSRWLDVMIEVCDALLARAFLHDPQGDKWFLDECKRTVRAYLEGRFRAADQARLEADAQG